ncbi:uncharacterized protein V1518DRAFT_410471 [Limtongia smithiae]|uniref:uncharacterized protein n=1 Tax=Limtongia smithiae TaxID=1125753 RepID=UPI0034CDC246
MVSPRTGKASTHELQNTAAAVSEMQIQLSALAESLESGFAKTNRRLDEVSCNVDSLLLQIGGTTAGGIVQETATEDVMDVSDINEDSTKESRAATHVVVGNDGAYCLPPDILINATRDNSVLPAAVSACLQGLNRINDELTQLSTYISSARAQFASSTTKTTQVHAPILEGLGEYCWTSATVHEETPMKVDIGKGVYLEMSHADAQAYAIAARIAVGARIDQLRQSL